MCMKILYSLILVLSAISCVAMDVDESLDAPQLPNPSSPDDRSKYCLFIKVRDGQVIGITIGMQDFFGEKIEIARTINPDTMMLFLPQLEKGTVKLVLDFLRVYQVRGAWDEVAAILQTNTFDNLIKIAHTVTLLNLYDLKRMVRDVIIDTFKGKAIVPHTERVATLQKLDSLEESFVKPIKNSLFGDFKRMLRDKNPLFGVRQKVLMLIPYQEIKDLCFAGNGASLFWVTADNRMKGQDLLNNTQLFDFSTAPSKNPVENFLINDLTQLTTNYVGSLCCLTQQNTKIAIYDGQRGVFAVLEINKLVVKCIPSNRGNLLFIETAEDSLLYKKGLDGRFRIATVLALPYKVEGANHPEVRSVCFSRNDAFLYVLYNNPATEEHHFCIYAMENNNKLVANIFAPDAWCVAPALHANNCWVLCSGRIEKRAYSTRSKEVEVLFEILIESEAYESLQINIDDSYAIINNKELINIGARRTDCIYNDIITFASDQKSLLLMEKNLQKQGFNNLIQVPIRAHEFNFELDGLFARFSLVQISELESLMQTFSRDPMAPARPLVDFIKSTQADLRDFVQAYCFPGIKLPHMREEESEQPAKKQKLTHQ